MAKGKGRRQRTKATAPGAKGLVGIGHNRAPGPVERTNAEMKELFLHHHEKWIKAMAAVTEARQALNKVKATAKNDGFRVRQFQIADDFNTLTGESKRTKELDELVRVAYFVGHPVGAQLDMFDASGGTAVRSSAEQAYEDGKTASMRDKPRKPPDMYAPDSDPYYGWFRGYDDHQRELAGGFKAPAVTAKPLRKRKAKQPEAAPAGDEVTAI